MNAPKPGSIWKSENDPSMIVTVESASLETDEQPAVLIVDASIEGDEISLNFAGDEWHLFVIEHALKPV